MSNIDNGLAPEARTAQGRFAPGHSGNPQGNNGLVGVRWFRERCREKTLDALKALSDALLDDSTRVAAAKVLLEFAWGKAPAVVQHEGAADDPLTGLSRDEVLMLARQKLREGAQ